MVVKIGTSCLASENRVDTEYIRSISGQISRVLDTGRRVLIVTSGAIGMGAGEIGLTKRVTSINMRQACAALG